MRVAVGPVNATKLGPMFVPVVSVYFGMLPDAGVPELRTVPEIAPDNALPLYCIDEPESVRRFVVPESEM